MAISAMQATLPAPFSIAVLGTLLLVLLASAAIFFMLTHRWTQNRRQAAIEEWADQHSFEVAWSPHAQIAPPFSGLQLPAAQPQALLHGDTTTICAFSTAPEAGEQPASWHVLIRRTDRSWTGAALRPAKASRSAIDLFKLSGFPVLLPSDRYLVCAAESRSARAMAASDVRGKLPPDIGLLLHGSYIVLDFSTRPFDAVEFDRMLTTIEQVSADVLSSGF